MDAVSSMVNTRVENRRRTHNVVIAAVVICLCMTLALISQPGGKEPFQKISAQADIPAPFDYISFFGKDAINNQKDPATTLGDCNNLNFNSVLLIDRSIAFRNTLDPSNFEKTMMGIKLYLMRISSAARARNAKAHIIIGAFGTYNVWQNIPGGVRDAQWKASIDISNIDNLIRQLEIIDEIYFARSYADPAYDANSGQERGYLGSPGYRPIVSQFAEANMDDALVQTSREISRWTNGNATVGANDDMDLVTVVTGGSPNLSNGPPDNKAPISNRIFRAAPNNPWFPLAVSPEYYTWGHGNPTDISADDTWRAQETVTALRTGSGINYNDINSPSGSDASPRHDGARPPVRVFGETIVPGNAFQDEVGNMQKVFGLEWADYNYNPPVLPRGAAIATAHRHFDKTIGIVDQNELVQDFQIPLIEMFNPQNGPAPCPPVDISSAPSINISIDPIAPVLEGTDGTITFHVENTGGMLQSAEIIVSTTPLAPVPNLVEHQVETAGFDPNCPISLGDVPCHYIITVGKGMKYSGGERIALINYVKSGEVLTFTRTISAPVGSSTGVKNFYVYVNAQLDYDHTSMVAANVPVATPPTGPLDPIRNAGFFWGTRQESYLVTGLLFPV